MKLTTIFTGHTLDLRDIVAIGPIMRQTKADSITMYLEIHLAGGNTLFHVQLDMNRRDIDSKKWNQHHDELTTYRTELALAWEKSLKEEPLPKYLTCDPKANYKKPKKDDH